MATKVKEKKSRWIHTFSINKEKEVENKETSKDKDGEEITVIKKVIKEVPVKFMLKRPTRKLLDRADLFYSVKLSEGIKAGLLTRTLLARRYDDDGGLWSQEDQGTYFEVYDQLVERENEYHKLTLNLAKDLNENKQKETEKVLRQITDLRRKLSQFEEIQQSIFNNTAENRARNQTIMWWVLNLSYRELDGDDGKTGLVFEGKTHEERLDSYDVIEEEFDDFTDEMIKKLAFFVSFWYTGKISDSADFKIAEDIYKTNDGNEDEEVDIETEQKLQEIHKEKIETETKTRREELEKEAEGQEYLKAAKETEKQLKEALEKTTEEEKTPKKKRAKKQIKPENEEKQED